MKKSFGYTSDNIEGKGFIDQAEILKYVSQEEIFGLVFGFLPQEYQYVTSPLRENDDNAGCWFEYMEDKLFFRDFGYSNRPLDCFHVVRDYFNLSSFPSTLQFVKERLLDNHNRTLLDVIYREEKEKFYFDIVTRQFLKKDKLFWSPYEISRQNLIDDSVFAVQRAYLYNTKNGNLVKNYFNKLAYCFTEFENGNKKLYLPNDQLRFISSCSNNDVGSINHLPPYGKLLYIKKSYKDCRVIRNQGLYSVWFQNEGMMPSDDILYNLVKRFDKVIVFYDNDDTGIVASQNISDKINMYFPQKASPLWLPEWLNPQGITDPSDFIKSKGKRELNKFLRENEKK